MSNVDTLQIYDDLKASGIPEEQAHAQAKAIANANRVTPEDLAKMETRFEMAFSKIDKDLFWMRVIGAGMVTATFAMMFK